MFDRVIYADERVFINGYELSGVYSTNGNFNIPYEKVQAIGTNLSDTVLNSLVGNINIERYVVSDDPIKNLTGTASFDGSLIYNGKNIGFKTGYMTNYKCNVNVGEIPTLSNTFLIYGNFGSGISSTTGTAPPAIEITRPSSVVLTLAESNNNRVQSFSYEVITNRKPQYVMGSILPSQVFLDYPIEINCDFSIEVDPDYEMTEMYKQLCNPETQNITLALKNCNKTSTIISYSVSGAKLNNFSYDTSVGKNLTANYSYQKLIM